MNQSSQKLIADQVYFSYDGKSAVRIVAIEGGKVHWEDEFGTGACSIQTFSNLYPTQAPAEFVFHSFKDRRSALAGRDDFTIRDEANALTALAFRNGFLEQLHAGRASRLLQDPGYSRISDDEMRQLMIESSEALARMLRMKAFNPNRYYSEITRYHQMYCGKWKRE